MLSLLAQEKDDISWQVLIHKVPRGIMAWAVRAGTKTQATTDNLARWGVRVDTKCLIDNCGAPCNLGHLLNNCQKSLDRYRFRHDSVLLHIVQKVIENKQDSMTVFADLEGWKVNGGTVPPDLVATGQMPDIVLLDKSKKLIVLLELTVPFDSSLRSFKEAELFKLDRYERLTLDLKAQGYNALNMPLEIGSRGVITARNHTVLATVCGMCGIKNVKTFRRTLGKIALLGSHRIYLARKSSEWSGGDLIKP